MSWGRRAFGSGTWGGALAATAITIGLSGNAATGSVGTVGVTVAGGTCALSITGNQASGSTGHPAVSTTGGTCAVAITGNQGTGSVSAPTTSLKSVTPSVVNAGGAYVTYPDLQLSPCTISFDATGCNYLVVLISAAYNNTDPVMTGITFNGSALTQRGTLRVNDGSYYPYSELWTLASPASGVHDVVITWTGYAAYGFDATILGLKDVTAIDQAATQSYALSSGGDRTITLNSTAYDLSIAVLSAAYDTLTPLAGQDEPGAHIDDGLFLRHKVASKKGVGATTTLGWSQTNTYSAALAGISLTGVGPATATIALSGNQATGSVGSVTPSPSKALTGNTGTGSVGTVTASITYGAILSGNQASGSVGTVSANAQGDLTAALSGNTGTGSVGSVVRGITKALTGNTGTGAVGSVGFTLGGSAALTGNTGTGAVGSPTVSSIVALTGVTGTGVVGTPGYSNSCSLALTGVQTAGLVGNVSLPARILEPSWQRGSGHKTRSD